jgi:hypothetical protein
MVVERVCSRRLAVSIGAALAVGEAGTLLLRAGTECENDRDNRAGAGFTIWDLTHIRFPRKNYSSSVNPTRKVT